MVQFNKTIFTLSNLSTFYKSDSVWLCFNIKSSFFVLLKSRSIFKASSSELFHNLLKFLMVSVCAYILFIYIPIHIISYQKKDGDLKSTTYISNTLEFSSITTYPTDHHHLSLLLTQ